VQENQGFGLRGVSHGGDREGGEAGSRLGVWTVEALWALGVGGVEKVWGVAYGGGGG
jgi:hypothetical protein